jgi:hypothetical protein
VKLREHLCGKFTVIRFIDCKFAKGLPLVVQLFTEPVNPSTADLGSSPALGTIKSTGNDPEQAHDWVRAYVLC